jgi:hypothetical protein
MVGWCSAASGAPLDAFMVSGKGKAAIEFLHFLADISDPATGDISRIKLAAWLGMTERELRMRWIQRGVHIAWRTFTDELLAVLDAAQAQGHGLERVIDWYLHTPIRQAAQRMADQLVIAGEARWLMRQLDIYPLEIALTPRNGELSFR